MKRIDILSTDYWLNNTKKIYEENLHVSTPVMEAYEAGYKQAKQDVINLYHRLIILDDGYSELIHLGDNEE